MSPSEYLIEGITDLVIERYYSQDAASDDGNFGGLFSKLKDKVKGIIKDHVNIKDMLNPISATKDAIEDLQKYGSSFAQGCASGASGGFWGCIGAGAAGVGTQVFAETASEDAAERAQKEYVKAQLAAAGINMSSSDADALVANYVAQLNASGGNPNAGDSTSILIYAGAGSIALLALVYALSRR